jgi:hypothetical protein
MQPLTIEIQIIIRVRSIGASIPELHNRGRPSIRPQVLALVQDLARFHGNRLTLRDITAAAIERGILRPLTGSNTLEIPARPIERPTERPNGSITDAQAFIERWEGRRTGSAGRHDLSGCHRRKL